MVQKTILAASSGALTVAVSSPFLAPGSSIINNSSSPNGTIYDFNGGFSEIITVDDTNNPDVFDDDDPLNHIIVDGGSLVADGTPVESESLIVLRELDDNGNPIGDEITINVYSQNGQTSNIWGFSATDFLVPGRQYVKVSGSNNGDSSYTDLVPCFVAGTMIKAGHKQVPVETIQRGDRIWTQSRRRRMVAWVGCTEVDGRGKFAPVRFETGVVGNSAPLLVSPNHRMLHFSTQSHLLFDDQPVLIPAHFYVGLPGVTRAPQDSIKYYHFMFQGHEIVEANGSLSESFYPGAQALTALEKACRQEIFELFPQLKALPTEPFPLIAPVLRGYEARAALGQQAI
ncbi:Hint domain-containing protein [Tropicibacter sp. Alg240-R139]|uniref:Hint domain-containing protein n=1 Tax=Tropicibacter sp. Alg240-R139 TaxID=2305991 RepID=UPI0013DF70CB|nr:Hint domain-containing protein [Tropicibacter sp. Alg240-R139]